MARRAAPHAAHGDGRRDRTRGDGRRDGAHGAPGGSRPLAELVQDCVHCGFCLPSCPTYVLTGEEADSPRGRIHLVGQVLAGAPIAGAPQLHLDRCLSCMACVTACPSGVRYDEIVELARGRVAADGVRGRAERLRRWAIFALFPHPRRLRVARVALVAADRSGLRQMLRRPGVARRLPDLVRTLDALAPALTAVEDVPTFLPGAEPSRGRVGLLTGCVQSVLFSEVNAATARVLAAEGFDVVVPAGQGCCGALSSHAGREREAAEMARRTVDCFAAAGVDTVVVNAAGCGSAMKEYARLLRDDPRYAQPAAELAARTRDFSELLAAAGTRAPRGRLDVAVAYHDACHLAHAQGIRDAPRALLEEIPGLELREIAEPDLCCGSAGVYNLLEIDTARELGARKAAGVAATGADVLVAANPGCLMQIRAAADPGSAPMTYSHVAEVLDASLRAAGHGRSA